MATDSGTTGFTLPGMMLLPGCNAGSAISLKPDSGPLFIQRRSFDIFIRLTLKTLSWPDSSTAVSLARQRFEIIIAGPERNPGIRLEASGKHRTELGPRVDAGTDGRAALCELMQARRNRLQTPHGIVDLRLPTRQLLGQSDGHCIHQVRAAPS